jgi:hypothetical protein
MHAAEYKSCDGAIVQSATTWPHLKDAVARMVWRHQRAQLQTLGDLRLLLKYLMFQKCHDRLQTAVLAANGCKLR